VPSSPIAHVSASPPLIPDGRISRVRLAASDVLVLSRHSLPRLVEAYVHAHIPPARAWFALPLAIGSVDHGNRAQRLVWCHPYGHHWTESPCASVRGYPAAGRVPTTSAGVPRPSALLRAHVPDLQPLPSYAPWLGPCGCAGCRVPLLGGGPSRCCLLTRCGGAGTRTPPRFCGAPARFFPQHLGLTLRARGAARWNSRHASHFHGEPIAGLQSCRHVQAPPLARPPGCSYRRGAKSSGQPGRVRHAKHVWLPTTNCGIATCLNRAMGTTGLAPVRLRPSRPLHARAALGWSRAEPPQRPAPLGDGPLRSTG
jgi:hypothetical protein